MRKNTSPITVRCRGWKRGFLNPKCYTQVSSWGNLMGLLGWNNLLTTRGSRPSCGWDSPCSLNGSNSSMTIQLNAVFFSWVCHFFWWQSLRMCSKIFLGVLPKEDLLWCCRTVICLVFLKTADPAPGTHSCWEKTPTRKGIFPQGALPIFDKIWPEGLDISIT